MAQIPTFSELYTDIKADLESQLGVTISIFGKVFLNALAIAQAGKLKIFWLAIASVQKNIFVDTADPESSGGTLERFGRVKLGRSPFAATAGVYTVEVNGDVAAVISAGTVFKSDDTSASPGKQFILDIEKTIATQPDTMSLRALEGGTGSRLIVTDTLTSVSPLLNVTDLVTVTVEDTIPLSGESTEDYRATTLQAFQLEAQGGAATDYRIWSADAQGVRFVYPYAKSGECAEIELYVEANAADSDPVGSGIPTAAILTDVEDVVEFDPDTTKPLNERGRRPLGVFQIDFLPVVPKDVIITFVNPVSIDSAKETEIEDALGVYIQDIRPFVDAADILANKNDILDINGVIAIAQGLLSGDSKFDSVTMTVDAVPVTTSIQFLNGDIPLLDSVVF